VTGASISNIDGLIRAQGKANLFLLNPNGIIFGPNASLNIGGSFVGSTANSLKFADGNQFSATAAQTTPLLTISVPIGLQFGANPGGIGVLGDGQGIRTTSAPIDTTAGLHVLPNQTLAMVGGDVALTGGTLKTAGGRIELGSVAGPSLVSLTPIDKGWALGYGSVQNFGNIKLSQQAAVDASGNGGGDIQVQGSQVTLTDGSQIEASTLGSKAGGTLSVNAKDAVNLSRTSANGGSSALSAEVYPGATGAGGDLTIATGKLIVSDGAQVSAGTTGQGNGGNLFVNASDSVELMGTGKLATSGLFTGSQGAGAAGDLRVVTGKLIVGDGAQISADTTGQGQAGNLFVSASDSVELMGTGKLADSRLFASGLFTQAAIGSTGAGGNLAITTGKLIVQDGAQVSASTFGLGNGGTIAVATNSVNLSGVSPSGLSSGLFTSTSGVGQAGNITVNSSTFRLADGAVVNASTTGKGDSTTNSHAFRGGNGGAVIINANTFDVTNNGQILTTTSGTGFAGNIGLNVLNNITLSGQGSGLFANAAPGSTGNGGTISISSNQLRLINGAGVSIDSQGTGNGGILRVQAGSLALDNKAFLSATANSGNGGNIELRALNLLLLRRNSRISTTVGTTQASGNDGNVEILGVPFIVLENSDITANAFKGRGGNIQIGAQGLFFSRDSKITSNGLDVLINIATYSIILANLPSADFDISGLIAQGCAAGDGKTGSQFIVTGRGGLPPNPGEPFSSDAVWSDARLPAVTIKKHRSQTVTAPKPSSPAAVPIVPATGWVFNGKGKVTLTARAPTEPLQIPWITPASCHVQ